MNKWTGAFLYFSVVIFVALFSVCLFPAPALSQQQEDVYIEGEQSHFKLEKGKRYHGKWTSETQPEKPQQQPPPPAMKEPAPPPAPAAAPVSEPVPAMEKEPEAVPEEAKPDDSSAAYEKHQKTMGTVVDKGASAGGSAQATSASDSGGPAAGIEISDQPGVLSSRYMGIVTIMTGLDKDEEKRVVQLVFTNNTGKDIQGVWGGFRIKDAAGSSIYATGVTDTVSIIKPGGDSPFNLFMYGKINEEVESALTGASGKVELVFGVSAVGFTDGSKVEF